VGDTHILLLLHYRDKPLPCNHLRPCGPRAMNGPGCSALWSRKPPSLLSRLDTGYGRREGRRQRAVSCQFSVFSFQREYSLLLFWGAGQGAEHRTRFALTLTLSQRERGRHAALVVHPSSFILHPSSFILHPSSFILHPSSFILHPAPCSLLPAPRATSKSCNVAQLAVRKWPGGIPKRLRNKHAGSFDSHCALRSAAFFAVCGC
jgi:hypothetical protein